MQCFSFAFVKVGQKIYFIIVLQIVVIIHDLVLINLLTFILSTVVLLIPQMQSKYLRKCQKSSNSDNMLDPADI